jgi:hypothetical protein
MINLGKGQQKLIRDNPSDGSWEIRSGRCSSLTRTCLVRVGSFSCHRFCCPGPGPVLTLAVVHLRAVVVLGDTDYLDCPRGGLLVVTVSVGLTHEQPTVHEPPSTLPL